MDKNHFRKSVVVLIVVSFALQLMIVKPSRAETIETSGELKIESETTQFFGSKQSIDFILPVNRIWSLTTDEHMITATIYKGGKVLKYETYEYSHDEWDKQAIRRKIDFSGTGSYKVSVGDQSVKFTIKKGSAIKKYTPNPSILCISVGTAHYIEIKGLDAGSKAKIYRATKADGKYECIKTTTEGSYNDGSVEEGKTYYYKVQLLAKEGKKIYKSKMSMAQGWTIS